MLVTKYENNNNYYYHRQGGYVFAWVCLWVCEFVCEQDKLNTKTYGRILMKFSGYF